MSILYCLEIAISHAASQNDFDVCGDSFRAYRQSMQELAIKNVEAWLSENRETLGRVPINNSLDYSELEDPQVSKECEPESLEWCLKTTLILAASDDHSLRESRDYQRVISGLNDAVTNKMPELLALPFSPKVPEQTHEADQPQLK